MDHHPKQLQPFGFCHRLFRFIMKTFAAQAIKTVTLGSRAPNHPTRSLSSGHIGYRSKFQLNNPIDDETRALLDNRGEGCREGERKLTGENDTKTNAPRKTVSIKEEPEIICYSNKIRRQISSEWWE
ncbi:hypothetical protein RND81_09G224500 [Saponaria officinalis]|uniref:Uncharacterized protein n=1 Tax=Saponaria officinalis TaxID=3572 RepID=A0AAW1IPK2_SAPOF